jgi:hypothetical protein
MQGLQIGKPADLRAEVEADRVLNQRSTALLAPLAPSLVSRLLPKEQPINGRAASRPNTTEWI